jgi:hypothetical protein
MECCYDEWAIDALIRLIRNVANQPTRLDCQDLADRLTYGLYNQTLDRSRRRADYLSTLPAKSYREGEPGRAG